MERQELRKGVMAVIVNAENKVLIGSSPRDGGYKFPQGGLEKGENPIDGIIRELEEELGVVIKETDILMHYKEKVGYDYPLDDPFYIFNRQELSVVKIKYDAKMDFIPQDDEFDELLWVFPDEVSNYNSYFRNKAYKRALEICGLL
ncbi:MAG: hypothetical protein CR985_02385 [Flavobacteriales bacterium]|nr:MAG: hypothetical protein CR985_02385 [Flavobacteriales bacterium]